MFDLELEHTQENAGLLLQGMWYSELPDILCIDKRKAKILNVLENMCWQNETDNFKFEDDFITDFKYIFTPPYLRKPGVETIVFYDYKNNGTLREMQMPNLLLYFSFIYNTLFVYEDVFCKLYLEEDNKDLIKFSNSYVLFEKTFNIDSPYGDEDIEVIEGVFADKNNKISSSIMFNNNKERYLKACENYLYKMKLDIESFFPNLYTHYFEKIINKNPYSNLNMPSKYFTFLDTFHQRINNNQTKGIPAGVFSSHIAAELCMLSVDYEINKKISEDNLDISYIRYVDDLTFFSNSKENLNELKYQVQKILNDFRLRINGNKTEIQECINDYSRSNRLRLFNLLPWLNSPTEEVVEFGLEHLEQLKMFVHVCRNEHNNSQIKSCLTILRKRIEDSKIQINREYDLFMYLIQLSQTENILACHAYKLINTLIENTDNKDVFISKLEDISNRINSVFSDTVPQIWHYYVLYTHYDDSQINNAIAHLSHNNDNPIILSLLVKDGKKENQELLSYIITKYEDSIVEENRNKNDWKKDILFSKWWLPIFLIAEKDSHNYYNWIKSNSFPKLLKELFVD